MSHVLLRSFLDGFTGGDLFTRAIRPNAPTYVFAEEGTEYPQREVVEAFLAMQEQEEDDRARRNDEEVPIAEDAWGVAGWEPSVRDSSLAGEGNPLPVEVSATLLQAERAILALQEMMRRINRRGEKHGAS